MGRSIYLDAAASTPLDPEVLEAMLPVLRTGHGNPSSSHWAGRGAAALVERAREQVGLLARRGPGGVVFTSGATEANNLALRGLVAASDGPRRGVVSCVTEHPAVLEPLKDLARQGVPVKLAGVDANGRVDLTELAALIDDTTLFVTIMAANNETGVLHPLDAVAELAHERGALVHSDASQLFAWGPLHDDHDVDLLTVSGHKMHGPSGVGALVGDRAVTRLMRPMQSGGGQERGLRSGTVNVAGVVGLGAAAHLAEKSGVAASVRVRSLRDQLVDGLCASLSVVHLNGDPVHRLPGILNVALGDVGDEVEADAVLAHLPDIAASTGSACSAGAPGPSHVLMAMGLSPERAASSVRLSLSRLTHSGDVQAALPKIVGAVREVRRRRDVPRSQNHEELIQLA